MPAENQRRIAVFLDFENLVTNTGVSAGSFDLQPAISRLLEKGRVVYRRAYADWARFKDAKKHLHEFGVELFDVPPSTRSGKNGADMRLVIDALELCYAREFLDTFVIGSGDSDFCPLAYKLRENNRMVIGLGFRESTSRLFVKACDEFIYLDAGPRKAAAEPKAEPAAGGRRRGRKSTEPKAPPKRDIPQVARDVVSSLLAGATGPINPSLIKETIIRREPDFDERDHGFSTFSKLLEAMEKEGLLRRQQLKGRQWYVIPADTASGPASEADAEADGEPEIDVELDEGPPPNGGEEPDEEVPF